MVFDVFNAGNSKKQIYNVGFSSCFYFSGVSSNDHSLNLGNFYVKPIVGTEIAISGDALKASTYSQTAATTLTFNDGTIVKI